MILDGRPELAAPVLSAEPLLAGRVKPSLLIGVAQGRELDDYRRLRRAVFVAEQGLFDTDDVDDVDDDPRTVVLVARDLAGQVIGGVRLGPVTEQDIGWWKGGRLVVTPDSRAGLGAVRGVGAALVRAACALAEGRGALRFEADVQPSNEAFFARLGWATLGPASVGGHPHVRMRWPIGRIARLAAGTKQPLGDLLRGMLGSSFLGDDGAPVPGSDLVAACDAIVPALVEREPEWAGWCGVLVNVNDLAAMGATPVGLMDAVAARDADAAAKVLAGVRAASDAYSIPVLGGHTQLAVPAALSVTALGRTSSPVPGGGGRAGHEVRLTADLAGGWRAGHTGQQWDSTTGRSSAELREMVTALTRTRPAAAKDVSMAGIVGTLGMLAEASGCAAELEVASVPRPAQAGLADWLTCFPGFGLLTTDHPGASPIDAGPATGAVCGRLTSGAGVTLRWPDGESTPAVGGAVTGLGRAG